MNISTLSRFVALSALLSALCVEGSSATPYPADSQPKSPIKQITFEQVELSDDFWSPRLETLVDQTIPFALKNTQSSIDNLERTAHFLEGVEDEAPILPQFLASDLFKIVEGAASSLSYRADPVLEARIDSLTSLIARAQQEDGYLFELHTCGVKAPGAIGEHPYSLLVSSHELYNLGHLYEAAVAYYRSTGKRNLLDIAIKSAHHVQKVFFEGGDPNYNDGKPIDQPPGHQEIELALCQLYEVTADTLYLNMARHFLDIRGHREAVDVNYGSKHTQQHKPILEQFVPEGHAVRAGYMYTSMADVDALSGTTAYSAVLDSIWGSMVSTRTSLTGGVGAISGTESFGEAYYLPNAQAYNETCAAISMLFFNDRMFRLHRDARYVDMLEVILFNGMSSGVNLSGNRFFYTNPLEADGEQPFNKGSKGRAAWFGCACCPPNIARASLKVGGYMYAHTDRDIYLNLYGGSSTQIPLGGGTVQLKQQAHYPFSGDISVEVNPLSSKKQSFALRLRIPTWAQDREFFPGGLYPYAETLGESWSVWVNGEEVCGVLDRGYVVLDRTWKRGDRVELSLPVAPRYVECNPQVEANRDRFAVVRGPLVYCAEGADNGLVQRYYFPTRPALSEAPLADSLLSGVVGVTLEGACLDSVGSRTVQLIPYYSWNNRGDNSMIVWMPEREEMAREQLPLKVKNRAWLREMTLSCSNNPTSKDALMDGMTPACSRHGGLPFWTSRGEEGSEQWAEFRFTKPRTLESFSLFWVDDPRTTTLLPRSWELDYLSEGEWHTLPIYVTDSYGLLIDQFNEVHPAEALSCEGLRLRLTPQAGKSVGVAEVRINFVER